MKEFPDTTDTLTKETTGDQSPSEDSPEDILRDECLREAAFDGLERGWLRFTANMKFKTPTTARRGEWVETLETALKIMPARYKTAREHIQAELLAYKDDPSKQNRAKGRKKRQNSL